jgi:hypothetical protein
LVREPVERAGTSAIEQISMAPPKTRSRAKQPSTVLHELFRPYAIPPSTLHEALQQAAIQAGWTPPSQAEKRAAGKKSGLKRRGRADIRRHFVEVAFRRLKPANQMQPYSDHSVDALKMEYRKLLAESLAEAEPEASVESRSEGLRQLMSASPFKADRETLIKDMKRLGIRSRRQKRQSG